MHNAAGPRPPTQNGQVHHPAEDHQLLAKAKRSEEKRGRGHWIFFSNIFPSDKEENRIFISFSISTYEVFFRIPQCIPFPYRKKEVEGMNPGSASCATLEDLGVKDGARGYIHGRTSSGTGSLFSYRLTPIDFCLSWDLSLGSSGHGWRS